MAHLQTGSPPTLDAQPPTIAEKRPAVPPHDQQARPEPRGEARDATLHAVRTSNELGAEIVSAIGLFASSPSTASRNTRARR
jgi:hypothetical protein